MLDKDFIKSNYSKEMFLLVNSIHWKEVSEYELDKVNVIDKLISGKRTTAPDKKHLLNLYLNENVDNIVKYFTEYKKILPNDRKKRTERNMILYYGEKEGIKLWKQYDKVNRQSLQEQLKNKYGNESKEKIIKWKEKISIKRLEYNKNRSDEEKKSQCIFNKEYWNTYGKHYTEKEKYDKINKYSKKLSKNAKNIWKNRRLNGYSTKENTPVCIEYWLNKGYTNEDGEKKRLKYIKDKCIISEESMIKKYGEKLGKEKWTSCISKRKSSMLQKIKDGKYMGSNSSNVANNIFHNLIENIPDVDKHDIYTAKNDNGEFYLASGNEYYYMYDFTIRSKKIIIEYNDIRWHPHPLYMSRSDWKSWKIFQWDNPQKKYIKDRKKINTARKNGYKVLEVWNFDDNVEDMCLQFIRDNI